MRESNANATFQVQVFQVWHVQFENKSTPGPRLMRVHLVRNSNSAKFEKSPNIHLVQPIIHLVRILALSDWYELVE